MADTMTRHPAEAEPYEEAALEADAQAEHQSLLSRVGQVSGRVALGTIVAATPLLSTYREYEPSETQGVREPTEQELERIDATHTSEVIDQQQEIKFDTDNVLIPRIRYGEQTTKAHTITFEIDEKWAEWFSADRDAGKVVNVKDPRNAMDFVAMSVGNTKEFEETVYSFLRDHKNMFEGQPTEITGIEFTGHASAEGSTPDDDLDRIDPQNLELAERRAQFLGPEFVNEMKKLGIDPREVRYGSPQEDILSHEEIDQVQELVGKYGYKDAVDMVRQFNQAGRGDANVEVPEEVQQVLDKLLADERYVEVKINYKTTEGKEASISIPWFLLLVAAIPGPVRPPQGPRGSYIRRVKDDGSFRSRTEGPAIRRKQPHAQNFTPNNVGRVQNGRKGVKGVNRSRGGNRTGKRG